MMKFQMILYLLSSRALDLFRLMFAFSFVGGFYFLNQNSHKQEGLGRSNLFIFSLPEESDIDADIGVRVLQRLTDDTSYSIDKPARWKWCILVVVVTLMCVASLCIFGQSSLLQKSMKSMDISNLQETQAGLMANPC